jgi:hypothetical protein
MKKQVKEKQNYIEILEMNQKEMNGIIANSNK